MIWKTCFVYKGKETCRTREELQKLLNTEDALIGDLLKKIVGNDDPDRIVHCRSSKLYYK